LRLDFSAHDADFVMGGDLGHAETSRTTSSTASSCASSACAHPEMCDHIMGCLADALDRFDRQMEALSDFEVTVTFCFTPEHRGIEPHHTSPPQMPEEFAEFCAEMTARYAKPAQAARLEGRAAAVT
jgi:hypothetical protein